MGCPISTYREMLINYIQSNARFTKFEKLYTDNFFCEKSMAFIESIATEFNEDNHSLACFYAGVAATTFFIDNEDCCDIVNAGASGLVMLKNFFNIKDNKV